METQIVKYNVTDAEISEITNKYQGIEVKDSASYKTVAAGLAECRAMRVDIESRRKELKSASLEYGRKVDGEAKRLTLLISPTEDALKAEKKKEDDKKAKAKAEKAKKEQDRVDGIQEKIDRINQFGVGTEFLTADELKSRISTLINMVTPNEYYMEFEEIAGIAIIETKAVLRSALEDRERLDKEDEERKIEDARLEKIRQDQEEAQKALDEERLALKMERQRIETEREAEQKETQRKIDAENARQEKERLDLEAEKQKIADEKKSEQERKDREAFELKAKQDAKAKAEQDAKDEASRLELARIAKEKADKKEAERQEALKPDKIKLLEFATALESVPSPDLSDGKALEILRDAYHSRVAIVDIIRSDVEGM